jgi:transposase
MLADEIDFVIGVDTHRDIHALAVVDATGFVHHTCEIDACGAGYAQALKHAASLAPGTRAWAIEGIGSYGAGLFRYLTNAGERVIEVERPERTRRPGGRKSDSLDAVRAAREALSQRHLGVARQGKERDALRLLLAAREGAVVAKTAAINQIKGFIVSAPDEVRSELRRLGTCALLRRLVVFRSLPTHPVDRAALFTALRAVARRARELDNEARAFEAKIEALVGKVAPELLAEQGIGPIVAAQLIVSYSHPGRFRSDAAFASLAGACPIPASSGQVVRHRLCRGGDRQLNRAIRVIVLTRMRLCPKTRAYIAKKRHEGKGVREAMRCLMRHVARGIFHLLTRIMSQNPPPVARIESSVGVTKPGHAQMRSAADILARLVLQPHVKEAPLPT